MMGGLCNDDSGVGAYATSPEDYDRFAFLQYDKCMYPQWHGNMYFKIEKIYPK